MNPIKILLAEDNPVNQKVAELMLRRLGYAIDISVNGKSAIEQFQEKKHDLILMDAHMPVMDGLTATRWIRENIEQKLQPKIMVMTATMMADAKQAWQGIDVDGFIEKPVRMELLKSILNDLVEQIRAGE